MDATERHLSSIISLNFLLARKELALTNLMEGTLVLLIR